MKLRVLYWVIGLILAGTAGVWYWQECQAQRQLKRQLELLTVTIQASNKRSMEQAIGTLRGMAAMVARNGNQKRNLIALRESEEIHRRITQVMDEFHSTQTHLVEHNIQANEIGSKTEQLDLCVKYIQKFVPDYIPDELALNPDPQLRMAVGKEAEGSTVAFEHMSLPMALAMLEQQKAILLSYEREALSLQSTKITGDCGVNPVYAY
ncbi:MAG TPA: hypothetical protein VF598_08675, partial [Hymenobacter sp.]